MLRQKYTHNSYNVFILLQAKERKDDKNIWRNTESTSFMNHKHWVTFQAINCHYDFLFVSFSDIFIVLSRSEIASRLIQALPYITI